MLNGECQVAATTWEWKEEIDEEEARKAKNRLRRLNRKIFQTEAKELPRAKLRRAPSPGFHVTNEEIKIPRLAWMCQA